MTAQLSLSEQVRNALPRVVGARAAEPLWQRIADLPVRSSRATRTLGSYVFRAGTPLCIRLQFSQEAEQLQETFLHELAHLCDHLTRPEGGTYRRAHGPGWKRWALALGADGQVRARSETLSELYRERLKPVAVCRRCGAIVQRLRRLNRGRKYYHRNCGGRIRPLTP